MSQVPLGPPQPTDNPTLDRWLYLLWGRVTNYAQILWTTIYRPVESPATTGAMDDSSAVWIVTTTGQTLTLPAASTGRIGNIWTVNFSTTGTLTVQRAGSDTIMTPTSATETSVIITIRGTSLDFECASATTWIIV